MNELIRVENLHKSYYDGSTELPVLKGIDMVIRAGEIISIVGASGVGKSTLLNILGALDRPTEGRVFYLQQEIFTMSDKKLAAFRSLEIGFVFQFHHLLPEFTALENVAMPALIARVSRNEAYDKAQKLLEHVGLKERLTHKPSKLSGGECQRVALARALVNNPKVILADEPTGNLDGKTSEAMHDLIWELNDRFNQIFIIATHNLSLAQRSDRMIHLVDGKISDGVQIADL
ncbi:TPA: ABC transporter ATP-binding protein [Candidatus Poribacteria bacterium]|nr:ABC transporter ATP-binding protein [Candidatus Poribacteria bacterium]